EGSLGCTVVDSGFGPRLAEIEAGLAAAVPQAPRWLINTHWHFDHTDGNAAFAAADATILAHANCRFRLEILNSDSALYGGSSNIGNEGAVSARADLSFDRRDNARGIPKSVVVDEAFTWGEEHRPSIPWQDTVIYEAHVKGLTQLHEDVPPAWRGTYRG